MGLVKVEKDSCAWLVRKGRMEPKRGLRKVRKSTRNDEAISRRSMRGGVETVGVCIRLHGSHLQQRRLEGAHLVHTLCPRDEDAGLER